MSKPTRLRTPPMRPAALSLLRECMRQCHPDPEVCRRYRVEAAKRDRTITNLFARTRGLIDHAEAVIDAGDPDNECDEIFAAIDEHKVMIGELLDE
jgi:hypothetical protein